MMFRLATASLDHILATASLHHMYVIKACRSKSKHHKSQTFVPKLVHFTTILYFVCSRTIFQAVPKLCAVVTECVSAFSVDFWLQTNLFQCGVLWHLVLYLFNYDFTLEESGVEKCDETNQQVMRVIEI